LKKARTSSNPSDQTIINPTLVKRYKIVLKETINNCVEEAFNTCKNGPKLIAGNVIDNPNLRFQ
jgi:hypothetical protein